MDRTQLFQHFETLAERPEAVAKLRKLVLELAVQGRLVPQDPSDESVELLLAKNDKCRRETARGDRRADADPQPLLSADDRWEIAGTWSWRALGDLVLFVDYRGKTPAKLSSGVRLLTAKNVRKGGINLSPEEFLSEQDYHDWMTRGFPKAGDVLFTTEAPMGNAAVVELTVRFALAQRVICFQSYGAVDTSFLVMQILSSPFQFILDKNGTGVTAKGIKASKLKQLPIAIPPLAEQRRIVAKVEELLALCDELEARQTAAREHRTRLVRSALDHLTAGVRPSPVAAMSGRTRVSENSNALRPHHPAAPEDGRTPDDFRRHAAFVLNTFPDLTAAPEDVPALRQSILSLAIQGHLVPQDASAKSAEALVERIAVRRAQFIKNGDAKKGREFAKLAPDDQPFELPSSWVWSRLGFLTDARFSITYGVLVPGPETDDGIPFVRLQDLSTTAPAEKPNKSISASIEAAYARTRLRGGEILLGVVGSIGKLGVAPPSWAGANIARAVSRIVPDENMDHGYLLLVLQSPFFQQHIKNTTRTLAQPTLNISHLEIAPIPVPPVAEQQRIVAKVDELMRWCDALEARLTAAQTTAAGLLDATLHQILKSAA